MKGEDNLLPSFLLPLVEPFRENNTSLLLLHRGPHAGIMEEGVITTVYSFHHALLCEYRKKNSGRNARTNGSPDYVSSRMAPGLRSDGQGDMSWDRWGDTGAGLTPLHPLQNIGHLIVL